MPTYEYVCRECGHTFEELQSMKEDPLLRCPSCGKDALARIMGGGSGLIFKGSGFYLTDYKKSNTSPSSSRESRESKAGKDVKQESDEKSGQGEKADKDKKSGRDEKSDRDEQKSGPAKGETKPPPAGTPDKKE
jgi:putative FmdB family regulatory protein